MKKTRKKQSSLKVWLYILFIVVFASSMVTIITMLDTRTPDTVSQDYKVFATTFKRNVSSVHWIWRAQGPSNIVILVHYDEQGKERARTPVNVSPKGWPTVPYTDQGCQRLWRVLMTEPLLLDGFRVHSRYVDNESNAKKRCQFSLASGPYFNYYFTDGRIEMFGM